MTTKLDPQHALQRFPLAPHQLRDRMTRSEEVLVLCHLGVPRLDAAAWRLRVGGLVERPLVLSYSELLRYPKLELTSVHQCCGSPFAPLEPTRRVCNVCWGGARLSDVLASVRPAPEASYLWSTGADFGDFSGDAIEAFRKDLPLSELEPDALLAYEMNGQPLSAEHGFPVRLVIPGHYGTNSVKWLVELSLEAQRAPGAFTRRWYNDPVLDAAGEATGATTPVWSIAPESLIVSPAPGQQLALGTEHEVWGWAWARGGASSVHIASSFDDIWLPAELEPAHGRSWQRFSFAWLPRHRGPALLSARAAAPGQRQPLAGKRNAVHGVPVMVVG